MYSVQFRTYRHQCAHYMHECIKSKSKREYRCIAFVCWDESEQAGGSFRMHMRVWRVEALGHWSGGFLVVLEVRSLSGDIPFSGYTSSLVVNLTPFPPNTGPQMGQ